jgi:hypothetical protein
MMVRLQPVTSNQQPAGTISQQSCRYLGSQSKGVLLFLARIVSLDIIISAKELYASNAHECPEYVNFWL